MFQREMLPALRREPVEPCAFALVRLFPRGCDPALGFEPMESGIQRTRLNAEDFLRSAPDILRDSVAMLRSPRQCAEDEQVERSLKKFDTAVFSGHCVGSLLNIP